MSVPTNARNVGVAAPPDVGPAKTKFAVWVASCGINVPLVVIGEFVTELYNTAGICSPMLETYGSAGTSVELSTRSVGTAAAPVDGPAKNKLAACVFKDAVNVPLVVTGELVTVKIDGIARPALVTVPPPSDTQLS